MRNLCALKISVVVSIGSLAALAAMPAKAQQVILTPGGTMLMPTMPGVPVGYNPPAAVSAPAPEAGLPQYDILTPEQLKPGKIVFRGRQIEIMASDDPRITETMRLNALPDQVWVYQDYMLPGLFMAGQFPRATFLAPPPITGAPAWDGVIRAGAKVPMIFGSVDTVILAGDDPRIPENLRGMDLGDVYYWAIDARAVNPSLPMDLFTPRLYSRGGDINMGFGIDIADVTPEKVVAGIQGYRAYQKQLEDLRNPPPLTEAELAVQRELLKFAEAAERIDREKMNLIINNPEIYSFNTFTWGQPIKNVLDAQGNVVMSKQAIMAHRIAQAQSVLDMYDGRPSVPVQRTSETVKFFQYEALGVIPDTIEQVEGVRHLMTSEWTWVSGGEEPDGRIRLIRQPGGDSGFLMESTIEPGDFFATRATTPLTASLGTPLGVSPIAPIIPSAIVSTTSSPIASTTPSTIAISPTVQQPTVAVQDSQNPAVDFAAANGFDRSRLPAQLNRQLIDSSLSNSRIFPGMR